MTAEEYRAILSSTGMKQTGPHSPASLFRRGERTSRRWASGEQEIDAASQIVLRLIADGRLTYDEATKLVD